MRCTKCLVAILLLLVISCKTRRDRELRKLFADGIVYFQETKGELEKSVDGDGAALIVEKSLPRLEDLVKRKKALEKEYPEIANMEHREAIHSKFVEFNALRVEFQKFIAYGEILSKKYGNSARYNAAVKKGLALTHYF
ncbi:MAG: hypothetical protein JSR44_00535 [Spirochaetes bacterium]|nr:hypothetical protein [Spirochaetota bacterium]